MHARGLHYVGDWHTHPEQVACPSGTDRFTMTDCVAKSDHELRGFLLVVVGTERIPIGTHVSLVSAHRATVLHPTAMQATALSAWGKDGVFSACELVIGTNYQSAA